MEEHVFVEIISSYVDSYLNNIAMELEKSHHSLFDDFGFPMFGITPKESFEQVYFQSYLESYTRKMINGIIRELYETETGDNIEWPEFDYKGIYNGYTNIESENKFGFEFINRDEKTGYRYTNFHFEEIEKILKKGNVDFIKLIVWENEDEPSFDYGDNRASVIMISDLFQDIFYELEKETVQKLYSIFVEQISLAVEKATSMISLNTLPGFTRSYMHKTRTQTLKNLRKDINKLSCFKIRNENYKSTEEDSKKLIKEYELSTYFFENKFEYAFIGKSDYAKSFLTSEYLYHYFEKNPLFDYTPIVSGYIKSIEQLLHTICVGFCKSNKLNETIKGYTLGDYEKFLERYDNMFREELKSAKEYIISCLVSYRKESRNHLFHKDYFNDWDRVKTIRENTIFLYVTLFGAFDYNLLTYYNWILGYLDDRYDRLFDIIDKTKDQTYFIKLNGKEYVQMRKEARYKGITYDNYGLINTKISFVKFDYDHYEKLEISPNAIPSEIWITDLHGNKVEKIWD